MNMEEKVASFIALSQNRKPHLLARFGHELTVEARTAYEVGTDPVLDPVSLRASNEAQHRVFGLLMKLLSHPEDVNEPLLVQMLLDYSPRAFELAYAEVAAG